MIPIEEMDNTWLEESIQWNYMFDPDNEGFNSLLWDEFDARILDGRLVKW